MAISCKFELQKMNDLPVYLVPNRYQTNYNLPEGIQLENGCVVKAQVTFHLFDSSGLLSENQILPDTWKEELEHYYYALRKEDNKSIMQKIDQMYPDNEHPKTLKALFALWDILDNTFDAEDCAKPTTD